MDIDEIDRLILQLLEENPRISNKKISASVKLTPQAVGVRIKKLKDAQIIGGIKVLKPLPQLSKVIKEIERFPTKIHGFDRHIGGGFPNPSNILLIGDPGVGTTTFCLKLLWTAINSNLKCLFFAIERPSEQVIQQLKSFGWDPGQSENIRFIDVYKIINQNVHEFKDISHQDILKIFQEMIEYQRELMPKTNILFFDGFTEFIRLVRGKDIEKDLINQLSTSMMKQKAKIMSIYTLKPHLFSPDSLLSLKAYADCIIEFRREVQNQKIRRYLLVEKMAYTEHITTEIEFHITNQGIILNDYMLTYQALQNPPTKTEVALFNIQELDYLTQGILYGTSWLLEIDSYFPLNDVLKFYVNYYIDGLIHQETCLFAFPKVSLKYLIELFKRSIEDSKGLRKTNITFEDLITQKRLILYDLFRMADSLKSEPEMKYFESFGWSSDLEQNLKYLGTKLTEHNSNHTYLGIMISDLIEIPLEESHILSLYEFLIRMLQKYGQTLLATLNPSLHSPSFINKLEYYSDGIIKLGVEPKNPEGSTKYIQIIKNPQGKPSATHSLQVINTLPYLQII